MNQPTQTKATDLHPKKAEMEVKGKEIESTLMEKKPDGRNLAFEFEKVYVPEALDSTPATVKIVTTDLESQSKDDSVVSPTCVIDEAKFSDGLDTTEKAKHNASIQKCYASCSVKVTIEFLLHPELMRELTQPQIDRISIYSVIHEINKEASSMAANDPAVSETSSLTSDSAVIDEEQWLLAAIAERSPEELRYRPCPASFAESIGEEERALTGDSTKDEARNGMTPNPLAVLSNSRTQLWKPSRSWWEARSGRNPWIEPKSHNKRWRYLWPMIHYHKFLARCIKKLKRNGVDVKTSFTPVSVFLRDEVCAVSDHLGGVSKFSAEEWLKALSHFDGWTSSSPSDETKLRKLISELQLKGLGEPSDTQSPLLKDQIDVKFLKAMAQARSQHDGVLGPNEKHRGSGHHYPMSQLPNQRCSRYSFSNAENQVHLMNQKVPPYHNTSTHPHYDFGIPDYNYSAQPPNYQNFPANVMDQRSYHPSMQSHFIPQYYVPPNTQHNQYFYPPEVAMPYPTSDAFMVSQPYVDTSNEGIYQFGSPNIRATAHGYNEMDDYSATQSSPFWGHLDPLAMTGIASPQGPAENESPQEKKENSAKPTNRGKFHGAKPLPLLVTQHYVHYGANAMPFSPATQFYNTMFDSSVSPVHMKQRSGKVSETAPEQTPTRTKNNQN